MKRENLVRLADAHAIVTGAARGIGHATCRRLLAAGARVSMWDIDSDALAAARAALIDEDASAAARIATEQCDITNYALVQGAFNASQASLGPVDILINNAGYLAAGAFDEREIDAWERTLAVNLNAVVALSRLAVPGMYERRRGHIVNISSAAGAIGVPNLAVYSAAKWAVWGFTEALRGEASRHGVLVSSIHPSYIRSGMFAGARIHRLGGLIVPLLDSHDQIAQAIVEVALKRGRTVVMRPRSVRLATFLRGVLPDRWFNGLIRFLGVWESMSGWHGRDGES